MLRALSQRSASRCVRRHSHSIVLGHCRDHKADEDVDVLHLIEDAALGSGMAGAAPAVVAPRHADAPGRCRSGKMTSEPSLKKLGKHLGKQVQHAIATWGSRRTKYNGELSGGLLRSLEAAGVGTLEALNMPKVVVRPLRPSSCCFPHASPTSGSGTGKQKTAMGGRSRACPQLAEVG